MTKTHRVVTALVLAAGASVLSVSGAAAAPAPQPGPATAPVEQLTTGLNELSQLNQLGMLMEAPAQLAPLTDPVTGLLALVQ
ncbi:hypothetical protein [Streptomyces jumonjinensis]|uniref:Secreted protein n=1 Tax=Streptomyces jumonjinensis TaxID=1945 RepID=A0A646KG25_STRJU|nr:hypothetical protein [Streptomyces jumonjinensis]MQT01183.1 hypothetical protein [Streptomyces jumonjinensis]